MYTENSSKEKIDKNFYETINILKKNNIKYWLCQGTLLGIIRDKDLIPWDHDIDIAIWQDNFIKEKIIKIMLSNNFNIKKKFMNENDQLTFVKKGGREVDFNFYEIISKFNKKIAFIDWKIPKNIFCKIIEAISVANIYDGKFKRLIKLFIIFQPFLLKLKLFLISKNLFYQSAGYSHPAEHVEELTEITFQDMTVTIPKKFKEYLKYIYGENWTIAQKKYNWIKDSPSTIMKED